jgi:CRISPR-associated protein Csx10
MIVGGFNRKWGLPLPQTPALKAGSVFVFRKADVDLKQLQKLEEQGIGERRIEGFGRIVFNWLDEETNEYCVMLPSPETDKKPVTLLSPDSLKIAEFIATRIVRKNLDILLINKVSSIEIQREAISNNQLSRLMIITRQVLSQLEQTESRGKTISELAEPVTDLLKNLSSNARSQFERTRLNIDERNPGKRFDEQICEWLKFPKEWINLAWRTHKQTENLVANSQPYIKIVDVLKTIDEHLALEYTLRLIMAISKKAIKDKNNKNND